MFVPERPQSPQFFGLELNEVEGVKGWTGTECSSRRSVYAGLFTVNGNVAPASTGECINVQPLEILAAQGAIKCGKVFAERFQLDACPDSTKGVLVVLPKIRFMFHASSLKRYIFLAEIISAPQPLLRMGISLVVSSSSSPSFSILTGWSLNGALPIRHIPCSMAISGISPSNLFRYSLNIMPAIWSVFSDGNQHYAFTSIAPETS